MTHRSSDGLVRRVQHAVRAGCSGLAVVAALGWLHAAAPAAVAQSSWNPFSDVMPNDYGRPGRAGADQQRPPSSPRRGAGQGGYETQPPPADAAPAGAYAPRTAVESTDLAPLVPADEAAGTARDAPTQARADPRLANRGADTDALIQLSRELQLPVRSPALTGLLVRVIGPNGLADAGGVEGIGTRGLMLYRAGRVGDADNLIAASGSAAAEAGPGGAALLAIQARLALARGDRERACTQAQVLLQSGSGLPASLTAEGQAMQGYCGAAAGNPSAAGLVASLAREQGALSPDMIAALEAASVGEPPSMSGKGTIGVLEWRLAEVSGQFETALAALGRFEPSTLVAAALSEKAPPRLRVVAAEAAARSNAIDASDLASIYRQQSFPAAELAQAAAGRGEAWARRALLFKAAEAERTPLKRTRLVRAALDDARRAGLYVVTAAAFAKIVEEIRPVAEIGWFAETAIEVLLAAGRYDDARRWARVADESGVAGDRSAPSIAHWLALIDLADPGQRNQRGASLGWVEDLALRGRFTPDGLHRLATVLDALDYDVPVRLWEAASRAPQPTSGHLPPTGVLSELQDAAKGRELVRTAGLVFRTLGADGPEGAHMIALGDAIRALRRAGLEREARAVAAEALYGLWPRSSSG